MSKATLIVFHKSCLDGMFAAWVAAKYYGHKYCEFVGVDYYSPVPDMTGRDVVVVDFSFKPEVLLPLLPNIKSMLMIDHHKTSYEAWSTKNLPPNLITIFDDRVSGALLAWNHFFDEPAPLAISIVSDYDLWDFKLPDTRVIAAGYYSLGFIQHQDHTYLRDNIESMDKDFFSDLTIAGAAVLRNNLLIAEAIIKRNCKVMNFYGYEVPVCNGPHDHASNIGDILNKHYPFAVVYEDQLATGLRKYSLRSNKKTGIDVEVIAVAQGGGGHRNAASFSVPFLSETLGAL
jgi:oligoribonuclease NrnB/cAMP/cGMP phosphodiesterase (DHH superfamily)